MNAVDASVAPQLRSGVADESVRHLPGEAVTDGPRRPTSPMPSRRPRLAVLWAAGVLCALAVLVTTSGCMLAVDAELELYAGINEIRTNAGLPPLEADIALRDIARFHSQDMAARHQLAHEFENGCTVICVMDTLSVPHAWAGENINVNNWDWSQTAARTVLKWQTNPEHLANMLNCHYTRFGAGVTASPEGGIYYSMVFEGNAEC